MTELGLLALHRQAERLLAPWNLPGSPGATLGVVRGGALALHESAGMASIEHAVPIGPATRFRIASVSKQFTCAAILLLAAEGRLSVEDPVRRHLPELPDFGITLDHLMRNCSGLRDMLELMRGAGVDLSQPIAAEALLQAVCRQRSLNFPPNTRFLYSNTGFMLLGLVVERLAGETLAAFLERRILAPLGMTRTRHTPDLSEIVPGLASGYLPRGDGFLRARHGFPLGGEGGLVSCVEDLALWDRALATGRVIGRAVAEGLAAVAPFENGRTNAYARGLEVATHRGLRTIDHGGLWPGYRTCFLRVPARDLCIIAIANHGGIDVHLLAHRMLDAAVEGTPGLHPVPPMPPRDVLGTLPGRWIAAETATTLDIALDAAGCPVATQHGVPFSLVPEGTGTFALPEGAGTFALPEGAGMSASPEGAGTSAPPEGRGWLVARRGAFVFRLAPPVDGVLTVETSAGHRMDFRRAPQAAALPPGLPGTAWHCAELDATWRFVAGVQGGVAVTVRGPVGSAGPWRITPIAPDAFRVAIPGALFDGWLDGRILRDAAGAVGGFAVSGARAWEMVFRPA